jgi:hypothetical protein
MGWESDRRVSWNQLSLTAVTSDAKSCQFLGCFGHIPGNQRIVAKSQRYGLYLRLIKRFTRSPPFSPNSALPV